MEKFLSFSKFRKAILFYWAIYTSMIQVELANAATAPSPDAVIANYRNIGLGITTLLPIAAVLIGGVFVIICAIMLRKRGGDQQEAREASVLGIVLTGVAGGLLLAFGLTSDFFSQVVFGSAGANAHAGVGAAF